MTREEALKLLHEHVSNANLIKHMLACEAVMERLARHFDQEPETWGLAGLLHDIDIEKTKDDLQRHSLLGGEILEAAGLPPQVVHAVKAHNAVHGLERTTLLDKALYCTDPATGLVVAGALIRPEKSLAAVDVPFLVNRFNEKGFARGANRRQIQACEELGLDLEAFLTLVLEAMQARASDLGL